MADAPTIPRTRRPDALVGPRGETRALVGPRGHTRALLLAVLCLASIAMIALPWLPGDRPMPLPPTIDARSAEYRQLVGVAAHVDRTCAAGALADLRALLTPEYFAGIEASMRDLGKSLDAAALRKREFLIGDLGALTFVHGAAGGKEAVLLFSRTRPSTGPGYPTATSLLAVLYRWNGDGLLLHGKRSQPVGPAADSAARAQAWAAEILAEQPR